MYCAAGRPIPLWSGPAGTARFDGMDDETRAAFAAQGEMMNSALAALDNRLRTAIAAQGDSLTAAIAAQGDAMAAGFARVDRYFELQQQQFLELRAEVVELRERVDGLTERVGRLEHEFLQFRGYVTREITEIRLELRELRNRPGQTEELRRDIAELTMRVERLERRESD